MTVEKADLEAKLAEIQEVMGIAIAAGVVLILLLVFLLGRRKGKKGSARVEVYRLG